MENTIKGIINSVFWASPTYMRVGLCGTSVRLAAPFQASETDGFACLLSLTRAGKQHFTLFISQGSTKGGFLPYFLTSSLELGQK
jgi:hypothetical protein